MDQFNAFLQALESGGGRFSQSAAILVCFLAYGGFRKSEAANVKWADVNEKRGFIAVHGDEVLGTKTEASRRQVPIIDPMRDLLVKLRARSGKVNVSDRVMPIRECQKAMNRAAKVVGMTRITHHDLRHG